MSTCTDERFSDEGRFHEHSLNNVQEIYVATKLQTEVLENNEVLCSENEILHSDAHNHTYFSKKHQAVRKCKKQRKSKNLPVEFLSGIPDNYKLNLSSEHINKTSMLDVDLVCNLTTSIDLTFLDYALNKNFENAIRLTPVKSCYCCNRFLYDEQVYFLHHFQKCVILFT